MWGASGTAGRSFTRLPLAAGLAAGALTGLLACQPVDSGVPEAGEPAPVAAGNGQAEAGETLPADLAALLADLSSSATEWQADPVIAEVLVDLDGEAWREVTVTFLAGDSDRMLVVQRSPVETRQVRPTLETLDLVPVPVAALADVPPLPGGLLEPGDLVESAADARSECRLRSVESVLYATGAPAAWDGTAWTEPLAWTATISDGNRAAVVDPETGQPSATGCLDTG